jgi:hypothetical protein
MSNDYSYLGVGKIYLRVAGAAAPLAAVGNCSALSFSINEDVKELKDYTAQGGGTADEVRRIGGVDFSMTAHNLSPANLAKALFGSVSAVSAGAVTNEEVVGYAGGLMPTVYPIDSSVAPVVEAKDGAAAGTRANTTAVTLGAFIAPATPNGLYYKVTTAGTTAGSPPTFPTTVGATVTDGTAVLTCQGKVTLVVDTDYTVSGSGILLDAAARITDGETFQIDYTKAAGSVIEALTSSAQEYELVFEGLNEAQSGKAVSVQAYRVKIGAAKNLGLITDDFASLEMSGRVLKDATKTGSGISQYFKAKLVA